MPDPYVWDAETLAHLAWFERWEPPAMPFLLAPAVTVSDPARFAARLRAEIAEGPGGVRARLGTLQSDLRALRVADCLRQGG